MAEQFEELWFQIEKIPDLSLNKYSSLGNDGVDGILERHTAFLRQLNRKGIVSSLSYHLFYLYLSPDELTQDTPGSRLHIYLMIRGKFEMLGNIAALIKASPLSNYYDLVGVCSNPFECNKLLNIKQEKLSFSSCAVLTKSEVLLPSGGENDDYYLVREWESNDSGRLYDMCKIMEAIGHTALYRIDVYPVEKSISLRDSLRKPMSILRKRQDDRESGSRKDYEGKNVLESYEELIEKLDSTPHFIANAMVFSRDIDDSTAILDAAGAESLEKGKYSISTFLSDFDALSFLNKEFTSLENLRSGSIVKKGKPGIVVCNDETANINLNYLPTLFTLEELAPLFRFPALYDGEVIQIPKETAPKPVSSQSDNKTQEKPLLLGKDSNGYDVYFPVKLFAKHAFVSGVPGSGKTNTMHHITSSLWKREGHKIPFLVLEPAKQEYRALLNDPEMKDMYLFSPNADMSFPLHINPFEMPKGTLVAEHIRRLCSVFEGAFPLDPPMPFLLDTAIEAVYRDCGWIPEHIYDGDEKDETTGRRLSLPTMSMLYHRLEEELKSTQYSDEVRGNLESALKVRIGSLLRREMGDVFDVPYSTFKPEQWLEVPAVIELESMGIGPANFLTLMLCSLIRETLKVNPQYEEGDVRHVIFIEEAHNLIGPEADEQTGSTADPKKAATAFIVKMLAEVRALKEGIVIADQLPTVMAPEVLKNTGLKLALRITSSDDRALIGSTMAASQLQMEQMATFDVGQALIFYEGLLRPFNMRIKEWGTDLPILDNNEPSKSKESKSDTDLRAALYHSETYQAQNIKSVNITLRKYSDLLYGLKNRIDDCNYSLNAFIELLKKYKKYHNCLIEHEKGHRRLTDDKIQIAYDEYNKVESEIGNHCNDSYNTKEPNDIVAVISDWILSLERLKCHRWNRFGITDELMAKTCILQKVMYEDAQSIMDKLVPVSDITANVICISQKTLSNWNKVTGLYNSFYTVISDYVNKYGVESLKYVYD